jgi:hypothetical protein
MTECLPIGGRHTHVPYEIEGLFPRSTFDVVTLYKVLGRDSVLGTVPRRTSTGPRSTIATGKQEHQRFPARRRDSRPLITLPRFPEQLTLVGWWLVVYPSSGLQIHRTYNFFWGSGKDQCLSSATHRYPRPKGKDWRSFNANHDTWAQCDECQVLCYTN